MPTGPQDISVERTTKADIPEIARPYLSGELQSLTAMPNYYRWILDHFRPFIHGRGVEFGAGMGTFSAVLHPLLDHIDLVEPSPDLVSILRQRFSDISKVSVISSTVEASVGLMVPQSKDVAVLINVLEHVEDDSSTLVGIRRILKRGGHLLLFVPSLGFLFSDFDRVLGHSRRYHLSPLVSMVKSAGFEIVVRRYFDLIGIVPWWLGYTLGGSTSLNLNLARFYDRFVVSSSRWLEERWAPPLGKNIVLVARTPF
jgi:SAM-dependent methyltransferase